jgi:hypothetical protein
MGGCPTARFPGSFQRSGRKRGLQTDLQNEIVQEIETLLGHTAPADLDFEAIEMAADDRLYDWPRTHWHNGSMRIRAIMSERNRPCLRGQGPVS